MKEFHKISLFFCCGFPGSGSKEIHIQLLSGTAVPVLYYSKLFLYKYPVFKKPFS
jgi:hypothetical protein